MKQTYNILFYMLASNNPMKGGIERVSSLLAERFKTEGCKVYSLSSKVEGQFSYTDSYCVPEPFRASQKNKDYIKHLLESLDIDFLIATTMSHDSMYYNLFDLETKAKIICHYHSSPVGNHSRIHRLDGYSISNKRWFQKLAFLIQKRRVRKKYEGICNKADKVIVLSEAFIDELRQIAAFPDSKVAVIRNPMTYGCVDSCLNEKEKNVLWVGRIDESTKRISSMLKIWKIAQDRMLGWKLQIVGGGEELEKWKKVALGMNLQNYTFYGFQDPRPFYEKASIYCLTSNSECWSTTLLEAMSCSCAPVLFNSFPTAQEIVRDGVDGYLVDAFDEKKFADLLVHLSSDKVLRNAIAVNAFSKSGSLGVSTVIEQWFALFERLKQ